MAARRGARPAATKDSGSSPSRRFRVIAVKAGGVRRVSRHTGQVRVPKTGWIRFRWSRAVPPGEKTSTDLARRFDTIRVENLHVKSMTCSARGTAEAPGRNVRQKTGLNRGILASCWGPLVRRLEEKAPGRVERINPAYTSQRCSACGHADVNAAINIAAGHAVTARGGDRVARPVNREPQLLLRSA
jgi:transposase